MTKPASEKQIELIKRLCAERDMEVPELDNLTGGRTGSASKLIESLFAIGRGLDGTTRKDPDEGLYRIEDDQIVRVRLSKSGAWYAQIAQKRPNRTTLQWEYLGRRVDLRGAEKMSDAEAGKLLGFCVRCNAELTDPESIERGLGPVCAQKQ